MRLFTLAVCSLGLLLPIDGAIAQGLALEEIVVTARKREESLQDVPLTISAFTEQEISRAAIQDLEDISFRTPGLTFNTNLGTLYPGREGASIRFRGIGDAEGAEITKLQPTSVFIDGAFVLDSAQTAGLVDLERVEVIKGPQAALFGRNSFAGAINYVTRNPDLEQMRGKIVAEVATFEQHDIYGSIEGPLVENTLSGLLSVRSYNKGSMYSAGDGTDLGEETSESISGVLYWEPNDNFYGKLRVFYQHDEDGPAAAGYIPGRLADSCTGTSRQGLDDAGNSVTLMPTQFICGTVPNINDLGFNPFSPNSQLLPQSFQGAASTFLIDNLLNDPRIPGVPQLDGFGLQRDSVRASLHLGYDFNNDMSLTFLASFNETEAAVLRDLDLQPLESWYQYNARSGEDTSFDIQLASSDEGRLTWLAGINYYEQEFLTSAVGGSFVAACGFPGCPLFIPLANDGGDDAEVLGIYASLSYDVTDTFTIGLEGRYQEDERSDGVSNLTQQFDEFLPRITASFKATDEITLYGSLSRGFLPGLVNGVIINCSEQAFTTPFIDPGTGQASTASECDQMRGLLGASFQNFTESQELDAYEFGVKTELLEGRLRVNAAAYFYDWSNQPSTNFVSVFRDDDGDGTPNANINALQVFTSGSSDAMGVEVDATWLPTDSWQFDGTLSYNDNEYGDYLGLVTFARANGGSRNFAGNRAPRFPEWSGSLAGTYRAAARGGWEWYTRGDALFQGETFTGSDNLATIDSFVLVNARVGLEKEDFRVELFVSNLFDEDSWRGGLGYFDVGDVAGTFDFNNLGVTALPQDKRSVGIRTEIRF